MRAGGRALLAVVLTAALHGCSEEDRRAWVSILPLPAGESDSTAVAGGLTGELTIAADSAAVLIGSDTLFTRARLPARGPAGEPLSEAPIVQVVSSPDSTAIAYVAIILPIDILLDVNYGYVGPKTPRQPSLIDHLPDWPLRVLVIVVIGVAVMLLLTLPWILVRRATRSNDAKIAKAQS